MSEILKDSTVAHPTQEENQALIQDELQRLRAENAQLKEKLESFRAQAARICDILFADRFREIPPEILRLIFERTIPPLSILDPSACLSTDTMWCKVFRQKRTLLYVCKAWYKVALPFLYEHIHIRFIPQLSQLLETLGTPGTDLTRFVNSISLYCTIPTSYADRFEEKLKLFFSLCPNAKTFSYLSSCPLPSSTCLKVLPAHVTHLNLGNDISYETLMSTLEAASPNLVSLSLVNPSTSDDVNAEINDNIKFPNLETLSCDFSCDRPAPGFDISKWGLPRITKLTLQCPHTIPYEDVIDAICRKHGAGLKYIDISAHWDDENGFAKVLDLCPELEHIVVYLCADGPLSHKRVKWVDIWEIETFGKYELRKPWDTLCEKFTKAAFPSLQGVRRLSLRLAYLHNLPLIFPPGQVLTPADSYAFNFVGLNIRHDVGRIHGDGRPRPVKKAKGYSFGPQPFFSDDEDGPLMGKHITTTNCDYGDTTDDDDPKRGNGDGEGSSDSDDGALDRRYRWRWRADSPSSSEGSESDSSSIVDWEVQQGEDFVVIKDAEMDALE